MNRLLSRKNSERCRDFEKRKVTYKSTKINYNDNILYKHPVSSLGSQSLWKDFSQKFKKNNSTFYYLLTSKIWTQSSQKLSLVCLTLDSFLGLLPGMIAESDCFFSKLRFLFESKSIMVRYAQVQFYTPDWQTQNNVGLRFSVHCGLRCRQVILNHKRYVFVVFFFWGITYWLYFSHSIFSICLL